MDEQYVRDNYRSVSDVEIAKVLKVKPSKVRDFRKANGLVKKPKQHKEIQRRIVGSVTK